MCFCVQNMFKQPIWILSHVFGGQSTSLHQKTDLLLFCWYSLYVKIGSAEVIGSDEGICKVLIGSKKDTSTD